MMDHDEGAFRLVLGIGEAEAVPASILDAYDNAKPAWDRIANGAQMPMATVFAICLMAGEVKAKTKAPAKPEKIVWADVAISDKFRVKFKDKEYVGAFVQVAGKSERGKIRFALEGDPEEKTYREIPQKDIIGKV